MTVTTPSSVFPHTFINSTVDAQGHPRYDTGRQWQYGDYGDRPQMDTGSTPYGNYVRHHLFDLTV